MRRDVATLLLASALYGFSIGCVHSIRFGLHNLVKFPLLFLITGAACAVAYFLFAFLIGGARRGSPTSSAWPCVSTATPPCCWPRSRPPTCSWRGQSCRPRRPAWASTRCSSASTSASSRSPGRWRWSGRCARSRAITPGRCRAAARSPARLARAVAAGRRPGRLDATSILRRAQHLGRRDTILPRVGARLQRLHQFLRGRLPRRPAAPLAADYSATAAAGTDVSRDRAVEHDVDRQPAAADGVARGPLHRDRGQRRVGVRPTVQGVLPGIARPPAITVKSPPSAAARGRSNPSP